MLFGEGRQPQQKSSLTAQQAVAVVVSPSPHRPLRQSTPLPAVSQWIGDSFSMVHALSAARLLPATPENAR